MRIEVEIFFRWVYRLLMITDTTLDITLNDAKNGDLARDSRRDIKDIGIKKLPQSMQSLPIYIS